MNRKDSLALTLVGPTQENSVWGPHSCTTPQQSTKNVVKAELRYEVVLNRQIFNFLLCVFGSTCFFLCNVGSNSLKLEKKFLLRQIVLMIK